MGTQDQSLKYLTTPQKPRRDHPKDHFMHSLTFPQNHHHHQDQPPSSLKFPPPCKSHTKDQMVLHRLFSFVCHYVTPGRPARIKEPALSPCAVGPPASPIVGSSSSSSSSNPSGDEVCCVCLSRLKEDEDAGVDVRVLPCMHEFHKACIDRWFDACQRTCPICRFSMEEGGGDGGCHRREELTEELVIWFSSFHAAGF